MPHFVEYMSIFEVTISIVDSLFLNISFHASFRTTCPSGCSENYVRFSSNRCDSAFVALSHKFMHIYYGF